MNKVQIIILILSGIIGVIALLMFAGYIGPGTNNNNVSGGVLTIWGTVPQADIKDIIGEYKRTTKINISYVAVVEDGLTDKLTKAIARNEGPDVIIHDVGWINANRDILSNTPREILSVRDYQNIYVDAASAAFIENDKIWAFPLWSDPLVLYWNKDLFNRAGVAAPPKNWTELTRYSNQLKEIGDGGSVRKAGVALGRARNIALFNDIVSLLLLQSGGDIEDSDGIFLFGKEANFEIGRSTLKFYTDFGKGGTNEYTWNTNVPEAREFFNQGMLAMMLDYISYAPTLRQKNPHLSFDTAPAPQLEGAEFPIYISSIGGAAVPIGSKNGLTAWSFAKWFSGADAMRAYLKSQPLAPARRDLMNDTELAKSDIFPLLRQLTLNSRRVRDTHPQENSRALSDMIEAVADDRLTPTDAIDNAQNILNKNRSRQK